MIDADGASGPDYYGRLGISPSASLEEIRAAYREKARETHPDHHPEDPDASARFQKVKEAYHVLGDPERRARYDAARSPHGDGSRRLTMTYRAPAGCGRYLWRVLAGLAAVGLFLILEAVGLWSAGPWTITGAVGAASVAAGLLAWLLAAYVSNHPTDISIRLTENACTMWADGRAVLQFDWDRVQAVQLKENGQIVEVLVEHGVAEGLRPVPPVLVGVDRQKEHAHLRLDLSDTDAPGHAVQSFLDAI